MNNPNVLTQVLQSILDVGCSCLVDTEYGQPEDCFISHDEPPDDCCDFLAIWAERIRPSRGFQDGQYVTGGKLWDKCCSLNAVADINLRLVRPCYPTLIDNPLSPFPDAADMQEAAEKLSQDIWVLQCCTMEAHCQGLLLPSTTDCLEVGWGDATPFVRGGCAGWTWSLTVELPTCC